MKSFVDGFAGYNQIQMDPQDMEKTSRYWDRGARRSRGSPQ